MKLKRFVYKDYKNELLGIAQNINSSGEFSIDNDIVYWKERLLTPEPYPKNSISYFTEKGLEEFRALIELWKVRCELRGLEVFVLEANKSEMTVLYEDEFQVIVEL